jgi:YesN/AraC family two-component response regulator
MVVDDEIWSIIDIKNSIDFAALDMECISEFQDPIAAIICAIKTAPDIIIVDLRMPNFSGIEFIRQIREQAIPSQIIILSAFQDFEVAREAIRLNVCGYCLKPIDTKELTEQLLKAKENLDRSGAEKNKITSKKSDDSFTNLVQYIDTHFNEKFTLDELAKKHYLSPNYCSRLFAQRKHTTFSRYVMSVRLEAAKKMLAALDIPLKEVSSKVGFTDYFYFSRVFKGKYKVSPKDYQQQVRDLKG